MLELLALWAGTYQLDTIPHTPPCAIYNTCQYMPNPVDGPLMPTWNTEGTYGGWTNTPVQCDVTTYRCSILAPSY